MIGGVRPWPARCQRSASEIAARQAAGWQFVFLSADLNALQDAVASGVRATQAMAYRKDAAGATAMFDSLSANMEAYRRKSKRDMSFTDEDRAKQQDK